MRKRRWSCSSSKENNEVSSELFESYHYCELHDEASTDANVEQKFSLPVLKKGIVTRKLNKRKKKGHSILETINDSFYCIGMSR
jgi:hypothetical protein